MNDLERSRQRHISFLDGIRREAVEEERERLREAIDRLPNVVFMPHDIERIHAGESLPLVSRRALWNLLNPEID